MSFMLAEICIVDLSVTMGLLVNMQGTRALINIPNAHLVKCRCDQEPFLILIPIETETLLVEALQLLFQLIFGFVEFSSAETVKLVDIHEA